MLSHQNLKAAQWFASVLGVSSLLTFATAAAETRMIPALPYHEKISGLTVSFLARDLKTDTDHVLDGSDLDTRQTPHSTFKIPNLLIALETGVAASLDDHRVWDPRSRPAAPFWPDAWKQDQTLGQAFARSAVWYFQELALDIGTDVYRDTLARWNYGNAEVPSGSDDFWLDGSLRISVSEQVDFLEQLLEGSIDISADSIAALDLASLQSSGNGYSLHGKTGLGPDDFPAWDGAFSGWYVGYLRREGDAPVVFALHVSGPSASAIADLRRPFALRLLEDAGLMVSSEQ